MELLEANEKRVKGKNSMYPTQGKEEISREEVTRQIERLKRGKSLGGD